MEGRCQPPAIHSRSTCCSESRKFIQRAKYTTTTGGFEGHGGLGRGKLPITLYPVEGAAGQTSFKHRALL